MANNYRQADGHGRLVGGPYLPPSDLIHEVDAALASGAAVPILDALARVHDWFARARNPKTAAPAAP